MEVDFLILTIVTVTVLVGVIATNTVTRSEVMLVVALDDVNFSLKSCMYAADAQGT